MLNQSSLLTRFRDAAFFSRNDAGYYQAEVKDLLLGLDGTPWPKRLFVTVDGIAVAGGERICNDGLASHRVVYGEPGFTPVVVFDTAHKRPVMGYAA